MRLFVSIIATAMFFAASAASAAVSYTVDATASGGDLNNMMPGDTLTLDITMRSVNIAMEYDRIKALLYFDSMLEEFADRDDVDTEFRYVTIPRDVRVPADLDDLGDQELAQGLVEAGRRMGQDPASWKERAPQLGQLQQRGQGLERP